MRERKRLVVVGQGIENGAISLGGRLKSVAGTDAALDHSRERRDH